MTHKIYDEEEKNGEWRGNLDAGKQTIVKPKMIRRFSGHRGSYTISLLDYSPPPFATPPLPLNLPTTSNDIGEKKCNARL